MEYRQVGDSPLKLPAITFGAWSIGPRMMGGCDPDTAILALKTAFDLGSTAVDTAAQYGLGFSEEVVAKAIQDMPRDQIKLLTKCGMVWEGNQGVPYLQNEEIEGKCYNFFKYAGKESIIRECENSLKRLKTDYIDHYSLHWPDSTTPLEETMEAFGLLKEQGKILNAGVCNHTYEEMQAKADTGIISVISNKIRYSMLNREIEKTFIPYALKENKGILAYCILQRGILSGEKVRKWLWRIGENPREAALYEPENEERIKHFFDTIKPIAHDRKATLSQLSIKWAIDQPGITVALLGAITPEQVKHDMGALDMQIPDSDWQIINDGLIRLEEEMNWGVEVNWSPSDHEYYFG
ncbi:aldo/keto reductase [Fulvivirga sp. M361]|uniref:aldo/keto reductase n=1 Tax=Fulvivirga sp. M361 TaxID=2594266 RepID=UPI00117A383A|nr:aldo/keto reductase [Fulvivirga sp. M361]TRX60219.1 aldo/keto reductase [Fulvivirga sp. M361]